MMQGYTKKAAFAAAVGLIAAVSQAGVTQISDFRLDAGAYSTLTYSDSGFDSITTRAVSGAPVAINSAFSAVSSEYNGTLNTANDIALQTFTARTNIFQLNRYGGGYGIVQWHFDLTPLDGYFAAHPGQSLTSLDLDLNVDAPQGGALMNYDVYLSYTNPSEGITLTPIDMTQAGNHTGTNQADFYTPAQSSSVGSIVNGDFKVLKLGGTADVNLSDSLLSLYESGVREFNLMMGSSNYGQNKTFGILDGSGLSITTVAIPTPEALPAGLMLLTLIGLGRRRCEA